MVENWVVFCGAGVCFWVCGEVGGSRSGLLVVLEHEHDRATGGKSSGACCLTPNAKGDPEIVTRPTRLQAVTMGVAMSLPKRQDKE